MAEYGSRLTKNRVKPGGDLGSKQYFYTTDKKTGDITVTRIEKSADKRSDVTVGTIPRGGKFTPSTDANSAEKTYYNDNVKTVRSQALQVVRKEWNYQNFDTPPNVLIYGEDAVPDSFSMPGSEGLIEAYSSSKIFGGDPKDALSFGDALNLSKAISDTGSDLLGKKTTRNDFKDKGTLVYPVALRTSEQDYLKIDMLKYAPKQRDSNNLSGWGERNSNREAIGTVFLPIPGGINSTDTVSWGGDKMDPAATAMANIALTSVNEGLGAGVDETQKALTTATKAPEMKKALSTAIAGSASGTGAQLLQRTEGAIINPNMELLFKDPGLRDFNFSYKLTPRSASEARTVISIIRFFKQGMSVQRSESNLFLKAPHTWRLAYKHRGRTHKYLNKFKECAMKSFTVDYTPDGNYSTFEDGVMTAYNITMGFGEIEPIFNDDYGSGFDEIGY